MENGSLRAQVVELANAKLKSSPELRRGQALFNALVELRPALAHRIRGKSFDPFHNEERVGLYLEWLDQLQ